MSDAPREQAIRVTTENPMDHDSGVITRPKFRMWLQPDGIVQMVWAPQVDIGLEDATAAIEAITELTGGRQSPLLVYLHDIGPQTRAARRELARRDDAVSAVALIVDTPLSRVLGNFFLAVNKPLYPTRLFDNEASALAWLQELVG
jgi:hypothetical protein